MPNSFFGSYAGRPLLDIVSYGRRGPSRRSRISSAGSFSSAEIALIERTVSRAPEVMVKVLCHGASTLKAVRGHFDYLSRDGELEIETDEGERLVGHEVALQLLRDWDLEVEKYRPRSVLSPGKERKPPRLVHKVIFSMPPGTSPQKVLWAVKKFARGEFGEKHRYAMVLHTDEPHPHVHLVVKAVSEEGVRLNIRKETLRRWRADFAAQLRTLGVEANATERAVRGVTQLQVSDGVYRAAQRGESTVLRERAARDSNSQIASPGKAKLRDTHEAVKRGWAAVSELLSSEHQHGLAMLVQRFVDQMPAQRAEQHRAPSNTRRRHPDVEGRSDALRTR